MSADNNATPAAAGTEQNKIWGKLKEPTKLEVAGDDETKASIRQKVWEFMEKNDIANFPRPVYNRIPNFKGANTAGQKAAELPEFKEAKVVKVNPDKPQEEVRYQALDHCKDLIVPTPRLSKGLFNRLSSEPNASKESLRKLASRQGIDSMSKPIPMASRTKLDLVCVGSVAVDKLGRRIGKGEGFADLEFAMAASHHNAVTAETIVISTVHDVQVFDKLPENLFQPHDLTVDIIVTPTEVIRVEKRLPKPDAILWSILSREKFDSIPILKEIQHMEKKAGKDVKLADGKETVEKEAVNGGSSNGMDSDQEAGPGSGPRRRQRKPRPNRNRKSNKDGGGEAADKKDEDNAKGGNRRRRSNRNKDDNDEEGEDGEAVGDKKSKRSNKNKGHNAGNSYGIFIGRIPRGTRVKELKEAVVEKSGARPYNIVWKGAKGFALLYFNKKECSTSDELCSKLGELKIGDAVLNVEPDKSSQASKGSKVKNSDDNKDATSAPAAVDDQDEKSDPSLD